MIESKKNIKKPDEQGTQQFIAEAKKREYILFEDIEELCRRNSYSKKKLDDLIKTIKDNGILIRHRPQKVSLYVAFYSQANRETLHHIKLHMQLVLYMILHMV